jgi:hypothetical protein
MSISLVGLTLHVADVERSLSFYKRLPGSSILFHMPGKFALLRVGSGRLGLLQDQKRPFTSRLIVRTWMQRALYLRSQAFSRRARQRDHGGKEMHWSLTLMATSLSLAKHIDRTCDVRDA